MRTYTYDDLTEDDIARIVRRPTAGNAAFRTAAASLCRTVQQDGDTAVRQLTRKYDGVDVDKVRIPESEINSARSRISEDLLTAIRTAIRNVSAFHTIQRPSAGSLETSPGVRCWREIRPIRRVGLYIPAGSAPLPSTLIMLGVPATLAGCNEIAVCSPPDSDGSVHAAILATAAELGLREVYRVGGVQAIAAMAFGTESIPKVDKIFGPGNAYVTAAKEYVSTDPNGVPIDLAAGPSELLIIADESADPNLLAADLLSQAEHDPSSQVVIVSSNRSIIEQTIEAIQRRLPDTPRRSIIERSLEMSFAVVTATLEEAVHFSNIYAPEHLSIQIDSPLSLTPSIRNAGSVFLGRWAPVAAGDYASGTNHTLPTSGNATAQSGVSLESFTKTISFQSLTEQGLLSLAPTLTALSTAEELFEHRRAVEIRFQ